MFLTFGTAAPGPDALLAAAAGLFGLGSTAFFAGTGSGAAAFTGPRAFPALPGGG